MAEIYGNGVALSEKVLGYLWGRQSVLLYNIANANTPGFNTTWEKSSWLEGNNVDMNQTQADVEHKQYFLLTGRLDDAYTLPIEDDKTGIALDVLIKAMEPECFKDSNGVKAQETVDEKETVCNRTASDKTLEEVLNV